MIFSEPVPRHVVKVAFICVALSFAINTTVTIAGELRAGVASVEIPVCAQEPDARETGCSPVSAIGDAARPAHYRLKDDKQEAIALALHDGERSYTLVTIDGLHPYDHIQGELKKDPEIAALNTFVVVNASHSHATLRFEGGGVTDYVDAVRNAVKKAHEALQPALIGHGEGFFFGNVNRVLRDGEGNSASPFWYPSLTIPPDIWHFGHPNNDQDVGHPHDPLDHDVGVLSIVTLDHKPIATLFNYAAHPVFFHNGTGATNSAAAVTSSDFPGYTRRIVDRELEGTTAIYLQGAAGDQLPFGVGQWNSTHAHVAVSSYSNALAAAVISAQKNISNYAGNISLDVRETELNINRPLSGDPSNPHSCNGTSSIMRITAAKLTDKAMILTMSGEIFSALGRDLKGRVRDLMGDGSTAFFAGYSDSLVTYITPPEDYLSGGYGTTHDQWMCTTDKNTGSNAVAIATDLAKDVLK